MSDKEKAMGKVGFGVIGVGTWGELHARVYSEDERITLAGVADMRPERAESVARSYGAMHYTDYDSLLADESVAAVSITTPDFAHAEIAVAAAEAGKHILVEKPLATTVEDCRRIIAAAKASGVKLMVDFHNRWSPPFYKAWESIRRGEIGEPQHVYYRLSDRIFVPTEMLPWAGKSTVEWFIGTHSIDTVRWLLGDEVTRVYAVARSRVLKTLGIDTPDFYQITLEFASGTTAVIENSWILPNSMPNIIDLKCQIVGSKGMLNLDTSHNRTVEKYTESAADYPDFLVLPTIYGEQKGFAADSIRHFVDCVLTDTAPRVTGEDGLIVTRIIQSIEESVRTGMPVNIM